MKKISSILILTALLIAACSSTMPKQGGSEPSYKDGVYTGEETGWPDVKVEVTVRDGRIWNVRFIESGGTPEYTEKMVSVLPGRVTESGHPDVDGVTGATLSSENFLRAVRNAMEKARR